MATVEANLAESDLLAAIREMFEDRLADVIKHMKDPTVVEGKPCTITLAVTVTPDKLRQQYWCEISNTVKLAPRESATTTIYASERRDGVTEVVEFKPQTAMF